MTICDISLSLQCLHSGEWYPSSVSAIPHTMSFLRTTHQNRHSPYATFNTIRSVNITTMKQDLCMICDCSINNQQENDLFVINLSKNTTCNLYCFQMTLKYHLPTHSLCFLDIIIPPNQHHSTEYPKPSCIDIIIISPICYWNPTWHYPLHSINIHRLLPFHMISNPLIQTHSHSQPLKYTHTASILTSLCNPWFQSHLL